MHPSGPPEAVLVVTKRKAGSSWTGPGPDQPDFASAKRRITEMGSCPGPDRADSPGPDLPEAKRPGEGTECPVCRTRTIVEYWVDDESWDASGLPDRTCIDCFNQYGPDQAELQGVYVRGGLMHFEAERDKKDASETA